MQQRRQTTIFHLAAKHNDVGTKEEYYKINVKGTENIVNIAKRNNINKIIFFQLLLFMVIPSLMLMKIPSQIHSQIMAKAN